MAIIDGTKGLLIVINVPMTQVASLPYSGYYGNMFAFNDDNGDAIFGLPSSSVNYSGGFACFRVDKNGNFQFFQTPNWAGSQYNGDNSNLMVPIGYGQFYVFVPGMGLLFVTVPRFKNNGRSLVNWPIASLANSCRGGEPNNTFYDPAGGYVAGEWIEAFGSADNFYSSVYKVTPYSGLVKVTDGYVGNGSADPFNLTTGQSYPYLLPASNGLGGSYQAYGQNGTLGVCGYGDGATALAFSRQQINPGSISGDCTTPNLSSVTTEDAVVVTGFPAGFTESSNYAAGSTDIPGVGCFGNPNGYSFLCDRKGNFLELVLSGQASGFGSGLSVSKNGDVFFATYAGPNGPIEVFHGIADVSQFSGLQYDAPARQHSHLVNFARPVSVLGAYKS